MPHTIKRPRKKIILTNEKLANHDQEFANQRQEYTNMIQQLRDEMSRLSNRPEENRRQENSNFSSTLFSQRLKGLVQGKLIEKIIRLINPVFLFGYHHLLKEKEVLLQRMIRKRRVMKLNFKKLQDIMLYHNE
jgi:hypothetical protein